MSIFTQPYDVYSKFYYLVFIYCRRNCHFSFAGFKSAVNTHLKKVSYFSLNNWDQQKMTLAADMAATFQYYLTWHIAKRVRRALVFCKTFKPECRTLVIISFRLYW